MDAEHLLSIWEDAALVPALLAVSPASLGGAVVKAPAGPVRTGWLEALKELVAPRPWIRLPPSATEDRLIGGIDLAGSLSSGQIVVEQGILPRAHGGLVVIPMAERTEALVASQLGAALDFGACSLERDGLSRKVDAVIATILLDEGVEDEVVLESLRERAAFHLDLSFIPPRWSEEFECSFDRSDVEKAQALLPHISVSDPLLEALAKASLALGVHSLRALQFSLQVAKHRRALLSGDDCGDEVQQEDIVVAARMVLGPRATQLPAQPSDEEEASEQQSESDPPAEAPDSDVQLSLEDLIVASVKASLPEGLLAGMAKELRESGRVHRDGKGGQKKRSKNRGRPLGSRMGDPRRDGPLDLVPTLRAAIPWQRLRERPPGGRVQVQPQDFRVRKFRHRAPSLTIFVVDASGSSAFARLAEAKGAVEVLLGDCYARRDEVALVSFRGESAELLLPPTRALVRAKRCLADLPGGGATPLASGLETGWLLAEEGLREGKTPTLVVLTDGKANLARDGSQNKTQAVEEALTMARRIHACGVRAICVDISPRPSRHARRLSEAMGARFVALPRADAEKIAQAVAQNGQ